MAVALPYAHCKETLVQNKEFAQPFCPYVAHPYGLGGDSKGGGFVKSHLWRVFSLEIAKKHFSFPRQKRETVVCTPRSVPPNIFQNKSRTRPLF